MLVLAVQTYPAANQRVKEFAARGFYKASGADRIIGITTQGGRSWWEGERVVVGPDSYVSGNHLPNRLLRSMEACLARGATTVIVSEWDALWFKPLPSTIRGVRGFVMNQTGGNSPGFEGKAFFHPPWICDADTARAAIKIGDELIRAGRIEKGFPDRFIGLIAEVGGLPVNQGVIKNYTRNALDTPDALHEAREARRNGAHVIHGFKSLAALNHVLT